MYTYVPVPRGGLVTIQYNPSRTCYRHVFLVSSSCVCFSGRAYYDGEGGLLPRRGFSFESGLGAAGGQGGLVRCNLFRLAGDAWRKFRTDHDHPTILSNPLPIRCVPLKAHQIFGWVGLAFSMGLLYQSAYELHRQVSAAPQLEKMRPSMET